jgi:hypothetical protein
MGEILIRRVKKADLDKIAEIEVECFPAAEAASKQSIEGAQWFNMTLMLSKK